MEVVILHIQLAVHTGSFCRCVTNSSPDNVNNRWHVQSCMIESFIVTLPVQLDVSARNPSLDPLVSVPDLHSLFLQFHLSVHTYFYPSLPLSLSLSLPFSLSLIWYTFRSLLKDKSGFFFSCCWPAENFVREGAYRNYEQHI